MVAYLRPNFHIHALVDHPGDWFAPIHVLAQLTGSASAQIWPGLRGPKLHPLPPPNEDTGMSAVLGWGLSPFQNHMASHAHFLDLLEAVLCLCTATIVPLQVPFCNSTFQDALRTQKMIKELARNTLLYKTMKLKNDGRISMSTCFVLTTTHLTYT